MATTRHVYYAIECDNCGVSPVRVMGDEVDAARYAKRFGWQVAVDGDDPGSDLCPSCVDLEGEASRLRRGSTRTRASGDRTPTAWATVREVVER